MLHLFLQQFDATRLHNKPCCLNVLTSQPIVLSSRRLGCFERAKVLSGKEFNAFIINLLLLFRALRSELM
jgi:hypothetical protein